MEKIVVKSTSVVKDKTIVTRIKIEKIDTSLPKTEQVISTLEIPSELRQDLIDSLNLICK